MEVIAESLGQFAQLVWGVFGFFAALFFILWGHFQLNENIAITSIVNSGLHGLIESNGYSSKIDILWLNLNDTIASFAENLKNIFLNKLRLMSQ